LIQEILASLESDCSYANTVVQEMVKILGCVARSQEERPQTRPLTVRNTKSQEPARFLLFPLLPGEIRNLVWEIAAVDVITRPKCVKVLIQDWKIRMAYTQAQSFPLVCKESFAIYFQIYFRHNHDSLTHGELNNRLAVNFAHDIFYLAGEIQELDADLQEKIHNLQKIVLDRGSNVNEFFDFLPNIQEVWLLFASRAQLNLSSAEGYQTAWSTHHCIEFPNDFYSHWYYTRDRLECDETGRAPCPICHWRNGLEEIDLRENDQFILTYPLSLQSNPSVNEITLSKKPILRWVRRDGSDLSDPSTKTYGRPKKEHFCEFALRYFLRHFGNEVIQTLVDKTYYESEEEEE
jgi:hypothetical protein